MIRPIDIQEKVFTKAVRGYKEEEVNEFLDEITVDLDSLLNELRETREENSRLVDELERLKSTEGSVVETLQAAKSLMTDISASAEKRAEILLKNAELDVALMLKNAREEAEALQGTVEKVSMLPDGEKDGEALYAVTIAFEGEDVRPGMHVLVTVLPQMPAANEAAEAAALRRGKEEAGAEEVTL